jgi:hypothetical protein
VEVKAVSESSVDVGDRTFAIFDDLMVCLLQGVGGGLIHRAVFVNCAGVHEAVQPFTTCNVHVLGVVNEKSFFSHSTPTPCRTP